jgi:hypothetical protein
VFLFYYLLFLIRDSDQLTNGIIRKSEFRKLKLFCLGSAVYSAKLISVLFAFHLALK